MLSPSKQKAFFEIHFFPPTIEIEIFEVSVFPVFALIALRKSGKKIHPTLIF
jgi:hypothetical protein